jgi:type VI secretion system secreted protein VgrG
MARSTYAKASTSLGDEMLMLLSLSGHEALGRPFVYTLDFFSPDAKIELKSVLNQPVQVQIEVKDGELRYIHGICTNFGRIGDIGRHSRYRAVLRPWLWSLTRSSNCRIFPDMTIPDVIKQVFKDHGFSDFDIKLTREYRKWEYLVQYRETAFAFVQRLMEQEGIYYYFEHTKSKHQLVVTDSNAEECTLPGYDEIPYFPPSSTERRERDHVDAWRVTQEMQAASIAVNDYDFKKPKAELLARSNVQFSPNQFELYDYPGEYESAGEGEAYARVWKEQVDASFETVEGQGNARGLVVGGQFKLKGCPREDQDRKYLVTEARYNLDTGWAESGPRTQPPTYRCSFSAQAIDIPYRPARTTPKPTIPGPQTAVVVAYDKKNEEIHTDDLGRVRVRFHWVRKDEYEKDSIFVRVAQAWAGTKFGAMFIPRVGQEVVVEFLEGDPDRPIITGSVYNAVNLPPFDLPNNKTQSGIKTRSSKGGGEDNYNEICFEDLKGEEQLRIQAERDLKLTVKHDSSGTVGHDHTHEVQNDLKLAVKDGNYDTTVSTGHMKTRVPKSLYSVNAAEIKLVVGQSSIHMNKKGITLTAFGNEIVLDALGVTVDGKVIKLNS